MTTKTTARFFPPSKAPSTPPPSTPPPSTPTLDLSDVQVETYNNPTVTSKDILIKHILTALGYPLVTVELTPSQFEYCISRALAVYTKYASFGEKYIMVNLRDYDHENGYLDIKKYNISSIKDISFCQRHHGYTTSDLFGRYGIWGMFGNGFAGNFITRQAAHEYLELARRWAAKKPDWTFNNKTGQLILHPAPGVGVVPSWQHDFMPAIITCEIEPPLEELYSNEYVQRLALANAKILLGEIRGKFTGISLPGGGGVSTALKDEGTKELAALIASIRKDESFGNFFYIV